MTSESDQAQSRREGVADSPSTPRPIEICGELSPEIDGDEWACEIQRGHEGPHLSFEIGGIEWTDEREAEPVADALCANCDKGRSNWRHDGTSTVWPNHLFEVADARTSNSPLPAGDCACPCRCADCGCRDTDVVPAPCVDCACWPARTSDLSPDARLDEDVLAQAAYEYSVGYERKEHTARRHGFVEGARWLRARAEAPDPSLTPENWHDERGDRALYEDFGELSAADLDLVRRAYFVGSQRRSAPDPSLAALVEAARNEAIIEAHQSAWEASPQGKTWPGDAYSAGWYGALAAVRGEA